jgi:uncharacterized alpha-E superfamily protein
MSTPDESAHEAGTPTPAPEEAPSEMLLSRVAESVYWAGRYLERVETTARIIHAHTELYLDLPRSVGMTWGPLLAVTGCEDDFAELYEEATEEQVMAFLTSDTRNPGSVIASLARARENVRTTRAIFPREAWEVLNDLFLRAGETCEDVVHRWERIRWTEQVIADCHHLQGLLHGTMSRDDAAAFVDLGCQLERADLTTRVLDIRAGALLDAGDRLGPYTEVTWMGVLKSLAAHQMYRRTVQARVQGPDALRFLLQDPQFPRSVDHCLVEVSRRLVGLSNHDGPMAACVTARRTVEAARVRSLAWDGLREYVDLLQLHIGAVHEQLADTYFRADRPVDRRALATA